MWAVDHDDGSAWIGGLLIASASRAAGTGARRWDS